MRKHTRLILIFLFAIWVLPARAESVADIIFDEQVLRQITPGQIVKYSHDLTMPEGQNRQSFADGIIVLKPTGNQIDDRTVDILFFQGEQVQRINEMPTLGGNPLVMVFLESAARAMAGIAGGSPFYIRNRIKESLRHHGVRQDIQKQVADQEVAVTAVTLHPFAADPNRVRMGAFAHLSLVFSFGRDVPGGIERLEARVLNPDGSIIYRQSIVFLASGEQD